MASRSSDITVKLNITAVTDQAKSSINGLAQAMQKVQLKPNQLGGLTTTEQKIKDIIDELQKIGEAPLNSSDVKRVNQLYGELNKEVERLQGTFNNLKASQTNWDKLIPKDAVNGIKEATKELDSLKEKNELIEETTKLLGSFQSSLAGSHKNFDISDNEGKGYKELQKNLKALGLTGENLPKTFGEIQKAIKDAASGDIEKLVKDVNQLTGLNLDPAVASFEDIRQAIENFKNTSVTEATSAMGKYKDALGEVKTGSEELGPLIRSASQSMDELTSRQSEIERLAQSVEHFFGIGQMIQLFKRSIREAIDVVQELDEAMAATAVVTDFSVDEMWETLPTYQKMANDLGVTIKDVYEASTLYYQQGLNTKQVMEVTNQTLQMARIAGIDAAEATDMMTAALRGFNMEVNEANAQKVNDIFSELAAITASDTQELGTALEKTASIANSAGMSIEVTSALLAQAIEATREAPENIGTAMKTIIARFQELKKNPLTISEVDGETVDFNKVDTALKTIGVDLVQDTNNFENLDNVLLEISKKWDGLTQTQRRYIATIVAGSRQQSRFIAMMGDNERLTELVSHAYDSAGAAARQYAKTQESLETAFNRVKNAWNSFLMGIANNKLIKYGAKALETILEVANKIFGIFGKLPGAFGDVAQSLAQIAASVAALKGAQVVLKGFLAGLTNTWQGGKGGFFGAFKDSLKTSISNKNGGFLNILKNSFSKQKVQMPEVENGYIDWTTGELLKDKAGSETRQATGLISYFKNMGESIKNGASTGAKAGTEAFSKLSSSLGSLGKVAGGAGGAIKGFWTSLGTGGQIALIVAGVTLLITVLQKLIKTAKQKVEARDNLFSDFEEKLDDIQKDVTSVKDLEDEFKSLATSVDEYGKNIGLSTDEYERYNEIVNELVEISPEIVQGYTAEGQAIVDKNTAIEKSIELLEKEKKLEEAEFYSPSNIKTALEGYEGDLELLRKEINENMGVSDIFGLEVPGLQALSTSQTIDMWSNAYDVQLENLQDEEKRVEVLKNKNLVEGYRSQLDNIYAQQANYLLQYADYLNIPQALEDGQQLAYTSILKEMSAAGEITEDNAVKKLYEAFSLTQELDEIEGYTDAMEAAQDAKDAFNDSNKDNNDIKDFNKNINNSIEELEELAEKETDPKRKAAIKAQADAMRDYKKEVISVSNALNPLASYFNKALSSAQDLAEVISGDDAHSAGEQMAENLETILDTTVDDEGNISWGKNEAGYGSTNYWKVAEATLGEKFLEDSNYDINIVDARLKEVKEMLGGTQENFDAFKAQLIEVYGDDWINELNKLAENPADNIKQMAEDLDMSEDALSAMLSTARQYVDLNWVNPDMLRQGYANEESVGVVGNTENLGEGFVLVSEEQLKQDFLDNGGRYQQFNSYQESAKSAGVLSFKDVDSFIDVYQQGLNQIGEGSQSLLEILQTAESAGLSKEDLIDLGNKLVDTDPGWVKNIDSYNKDNVETLVDSIMENDDTVEPIDSIKDTTNEILTTLNAIAAKEGVLTESTREDIEKNIDFSNAQLEDIDIEGYDENQLTDLKEELSKQKEQNQELIETLTDLQKNGKDAATRDNAKKLAEKVTKNDEELDKKIDEIDQALGNRSSLSMASNVAKDYQSQNTSEPQDKQQLLEDLSSQFITDSFDMRDLLIKPKADVDDEDFWNKYHKLESALNEFKELKADATLSADNSLFFSTLNNTQTAMKAFSRSSATSVIKVNDSEAVSAINNVDSGIKELPIGKAIFININGIVAQGLNSMLGKLGFNLGIGSGRRNVVQLGQTYYEGGKGKSIAAAIKTESSTGTYDPDETGSGGGGSGGSGGTTDSTTEKDTTPLSKELSKINNYLQKILYYNRLQEIAAAKYESLVTNNSRDSSSTLGAEISKEIEGIKGTIRYQKGILNHESTYSSTIKSELTADLQEALKSDLGDKKYDKLGSDAKSLSKYLDIDWKNRTVMITNAGLKATGEVKQAITAAQSTLEEWFGDLFDAEKGIYENTTELNNLLKEQKQAASDYYDSIRDGIVAYREDSISRLSQINDTITDSNKKILDTTKESIELQRQNRENEKARQNLEDKRTRLSLLMQDTSGGHQAEIAQLQKELADETQDYQDSLVDQKLEAIEKSNEKAQEQRERQIDLLTKQLNWAQDTGKIWDEVSKIAIAAYEDGAFNVKSEAGEYIKHGKGYSSANKYDQQVMTSEIRESGERAAYQQIKEGDIDRKKTIKERLANGYHTAGDSVKLDLGNGKTAKGVVQSNGTIKWTDNGTTVTLKDSNVSYDYDTKTYTVKNASTLLKNQKAADKKAAAAAAAAKKTTPSSSSSAHGYLAKLPEKVLSTKDQIKNLQKGLNDLQKAKIISFGGNKALSVDGIIGPKTKEAVRALQKKIGVTQDGIWGPVTGKAAHKKYPKYKTGGLADFTGPAWLDGTSSKPELVLNAADTQNFLELKDILASIMKYNGLKSDSIDSISNRDTTFEININVDHINNDYDVDKIANRVTQLISKSASYRNVTKVTNYR